MNQVKINRAEEIKLYRDFNKTNSVRIIRQITRHINAEINYYLSKGGHSQLSARHLSVFENLDFEGTNIVTLAQRAAMTKQAMSKLVKEVIQEGYVKAVIDERDSRALIIHFTDKGIIFLRDMRETIQHVRNKIKEDKSNNLDAYQSNNVIDGLIYVLNFLENTSHSSLN